MTIKYQMHDIFDAAMHSPMPWRALRDGGVSQFIVALLFVRRRRAGGEDDDEKYH